MKRIIETLKTLKTLTVSAAILDASGTIVAVNEAWKDFGRRNGLATPDSGIGANYIKYCGSNGPGPAPLATGLKQLLAGKRDLLTMVYPCHSPRKKRWFSLIALPLSLDRPGGVALLHVNLTDTLPLPIADRPKEIEADRRSEHRAAAGLREVSGTVEHSVLETLSSQLSAMLADTHRAMALGTAAACDDAEPMQAQLSKRQMQVLRLIGEGKTNKEIAEALFRSPNTIKLHVSAILQRLNLRSRTQAALLASKLYNGGSAEAAGGAAAPAKKARTVVA